MQYNLPCSDRNQDKIPIKHLCNMLQELAFYLQPARCIFHFTLWKTYSTKRQLEIRAHTNLTCHPNELKWRWSLKWQFFLNRTKIKTKYRPFSSGGDAFTYTKGLLVSPHGTGDLSFSTKTFSCPELVLKDRYLGSLAYTYPTSSFLYIGLPWKKAVMLTSQRKTIGRSKVSDL